MLSSSLGIKGWGESIDLIIEASIITGDPLLMISGFGQAKTSLADRFGQVLLRQLKKTRPDELLNVSVLNAATAQPEDWTGYYLPPEDNSNVMRLIKSPQTLIDSIMIVLDEISRVDDRNQNKMTGLIQEGRVDGIKTKMEILWALMNPPTGEYSDEGTEVLLGSIADRFATMVEIPNFHDMPETTKRDVAMIAYQPRTQRTLFNSDDEVYDLGHQEYIVSENDGDAIWEYLREAKQLYMDLCFGDANKTHANIISLYVAKISQICRQNLSDRFYISGRRAGMMVRAILAHHAIMTVLGKAELEVSAESILLHSLMNKPMGADYNPAALQTAHTGAVLLLAGSGDAMTAIMAEPDKWERLRLAIEKPEIEPKDFSKLFKDVLKDAGDNYNLAQAAIGCAVFEILVARLGKHEMSFVATAVSEVLVTIEHTTSVAVANEEDQMVYEQMKNALENGGIAGNRKVLVALWAKRKSSARSINEVWSQANHYFDKALGLVQGEGGA